ncbi:hypothetical protein [Lysobacter solisilvae (ex Woo and Kim 2020)]|uniref:DUF1570 domain-containing protein n=1 Tax=Agrilutibacter terrestris TaxID=2865112 RepID=A0A7H0G0Y1_9GAMM|nr:hypothetical protein [Lysobacter terrestris]QNP41947.1 hypothetical protein H8B22_07065 [Lysobacter terrestris]
MSNKVWRAISAIVLLGGLAALAVRYSDAGVAVPGTARSTEIPQRPLLPRAASVSETTHYRIHSTAPTTQTAQVAQAVEALHARYVGMFPVKPGGASKLSLVLYRDRAEFKRNNRSRPWAEAYYLPPHSYAYFDANARNPYHWMLHEATHQLMREASGFPRAKWIDEGAASYFGASRLVAGSLQLGEPDPDAYPIWWLSQQQLSGVLEDDIAAGWVIPLDQLITGRGGPDMNQYFNQYYIHYWSLSHFLFHYRDGIYAERYKQLMVEGGSLEAFTRLIGPPERIQREWYGYLQQLVNAQR